jgi:predicted ester cyclase
MSTEQNKATMRRLYDEVINTGNLDLAGHFVATDAIEHEEFPGITQGLEGFKQFFKMFRAAFPDLHFTVEDMLAEGDKVTSRITIRGTHQREFMDMAPTGRQIQVAAIDICRFADGKMVEHWGQTDTLGMMEQLGVIAVPGAGGS